MSKKQQEDQPVILRKITKAVVDGWWHGQKGGLAIWVQAGDEQDALSILGGGAVEAATSFPTRGEDYLYRRGSDVLRKSYGSD